MASQAMKKPNVVFVFSDQHRADAMGFSGNPDVLTPHLDRLANECLNFSTAVSVMPVCTPYRATLMTGRYPLSTGVFVNDVQLSPDEVSIADAFQQGGYDTAYIGKWHLDGRGRSNFIPRERRQGFEFWRVLECTHDYHHSDYFGDEPVKLQWEGYDAEAQTRCAQQYIKQRNKEKPFFLMLSWGPPHNPFNTAPQSYQDLYDPDKLTLRPNVPEENIPQARIDLAGYYAHISALDGLVGELLDTLTVEEIAEETIFVYASDHGDMIGSQGQQRKQRPWGESIRVPFMLRYPAQFGRNSRNIEQPFNSPDIMPTLLDLCQLAIPNTVEGMNYAPYLRGESELAVKAALIECIHPFGEFMKSKQLGGREYRGIRTVRYTFVRDLQGPWLLYDNEKDPYQLQNLCHDPTQQELQQELDDLLTEMLLAHKDEFLSGDHYIQKWGYVVDERGTVPYHS